jgi:hypothetical protein
VPHVRPVHRGEPVLGEPRVAEVFTALDRGHIAQVSLHPPAELGRMPRPAVARHDLAHRQGRQALQPGAVLPHRVGHGQVEDWYLDV